ncbi:MAG: hypothetical protein ACFNVT_05695 [Corynebacterium matruchotii]|uniref:hypothetical protein n=1 Tax=Corynebacterium matruchotii TaxID=43768 RepID=UPI003610EF68
MPAPYTLSESTFPYKHPCAASLASMRRRRSLHGIPAPPYSQRLQINTPPPLPP